MTYVWAAALALALSACSGEADEVLSQIGQETENASRAELVEATVAINADNTLQAALEAAGKTNVQKLTLTGELRAVDGVYLKTLSNLQILDMSDVTIKESNHEGHQYEENKIPQSMFDGMVSVSELKFPNNITSIGAYACANCTSLKSIVVPDKVEYIGYYAFANCKLLTSAVIPASVTELGSYMFQSDEELTTVKLLANPEDNSIPENTFQFCSKLETIELSSSITTVKRDAFAACTALKDYTPFANITNIEWYAFHSCSFVSLDLSKVTSFGEGVFAYNKALTTVNLSTELTTIGHRVFNDCSALTEISLPTSLETIGNEAFAGTAIASVTIPDKVNSIGNNAFGNTNLITVTIPETVTKTDGFLFYGCKQLNAIFWNSLADAYDRPNSWDFNPYCFLYLKKIDGKTATCGPNWKNIIIDNEAEIVEFANDDYNNIQSFLIPQAFKAKKIVYKRNFNNRNHSYIELGQSGNWRTIVLPFTPTSYSHAENGVLAPFDSQVEGAKPFWLRELTQEGFADVIEMKPNVPYIIAMPYNPDIYLPEYNIRGEVVFSAEDVEIAQTPDVLPAVKGPAFNLQPTYQKVGKGPTVYALNTEYWVDGHNYGSVFVRSTQDIYPFEAYAVNHASRLAILPVDTRSVHTRAASQPNTTGIPAIGDM